MCEIAPSSVTVGRCVHHNSHYTTVLGHELLVWFVKVLCPTWNGSFRRPPSSQSLVLVRKN